MIDLLAALLLALSSITAGTRPLDPPRPTATLSPQQQGALEALNEPIGWECVRVSAHEEDCRALLP